MKALVWDIETAPMVATTWTLYPKFLSHDAILRDWYIISGAWKLVGVKGVKSAAIKPEDAARYLKDGGEPPDRAVVEALVKAVREADFIIAHNGDRFDLKKLNARVIHYGMEALPPIRTVDTLKEARKIAAFSSNRLDYLTKSLLDGGKIKTTYSLWLRVLHGDARALKEMLRYNRKDVTELEALYLRLRPYMKSHPNVALDGSGNTLKCPRCASIKVQRRGDIKTMTQIYTRYHCTACGAWSRASRLTGGVLK